MGLGVSLRLGPEDIGNTTGDTVYIWTCTYNDQLFVKQPELRPCFGEPKVVADGGLPAVSSLLRRTRGP